MFDKQLDSSREINTNYIVMGRQSEGDTSARATMMRHCEDKRVCTRYIKLIGPGNGCEFMQVRPIMFGRTLESHSLSHW